MKTFLSPLTLQEEKNYLKQMNEGSLEAKHVLVERNMRLVAHVARKYQNVEEDMEDLISIGCIGLIKAVDTFREEKGNRLATYAARCIDNELLMYLRSKRKNVKGVSLYEPIGTDKEGNQIQLMDIVENAEPDVVEMMERDKNIRKLYALMPRVLTKRESEILYLRYGLVTDRPITQREIAAHFHISRSYVSRIEKKAIEKLRCYFENEL
ncbi:MAG: RNA polymerase sporulation sigma factor SigK [Lachnospiraceae bacterium]|nr:RNA polymerase sporulation sigma factor SigK [Lachnospiraceae bacterium]